MPLSKSTNCHKINNLQNAMYLFVAVNVIMSIFSSDRGLIQLTEMEKQFQDRIKEIIEERDLLMYALIIIVLFLVSNEINSFI